MKVTRPEGNEVNRARSGVTPMPPAIISTGPSQPLSASRPPEGPSATTLVPGRRAGSRELWRPETVAVMRSRRPSGSADSEYGWATYHVLRVRKRQRKYWPGSAGN